MKGVSDVGLSETMKALGDPVRFGELVETALQDL